ncbi:hypothetical protein O988_04838 [Pseudogymnoascus sp. VKM F-3808]|nr:hypothetical protein O988_04838 [Pseudogymnoascus sp. VKM F-3808]
MVSRASVIGVLLLELAFTVLGQQTVYGQCGGSGWTGPTECVAGACCSTNNQWYSQCLPGDCTAGVTTSTVRATPTNSSGPGIPTATSGSGLPTAISISSGCGKSPGLNSGTFSITSSGQERQYTLSLPENYDPNSSYKLIFGLHWLDGTMQDVASGSYYGVMPLSDNKVIFVAPQGLNNGWANTGGQDIVLIDDILATLKEALCIEKTQIYSMGWSYGGSMSYALACSRPDVFRGVAVMSGANLSGCSPGTEPVAYYAQHGGSDDVLAISMGRQIRDTFVKNNGCSSQNPPEPNAGSGTHIKTEYSGCSDDHPIPAPALPEFHRAVDATEDHTGNREICCGGQLQERLISPDRREAAEEDVLVQPCENASGDKLEYDAPDHDGSGGVSRLLFTKSLASQGATDALHNEGYNIDTSKLAKGTEDEDDQPPLAIMIGLPAVGDKRPEEENGEDDSGHEFWFITKYIRDF